MLGLITEKKAAKKTINAIAPFVKALQQLSIQQSFNRNASFPVYGYGNQTEQVSAYATVADLYAVTNRVMKTAALIPIYEYNVVNKKAYSIYKIELKKYLKHPSNKKLYEVKKLQTTALELAGEDSELQKLLDHPNKFQSKTEFYQLCFLFILLSGNRYLYKNLLNAGANEGKVYEVYNLPPNFTFPIPSDTLPRRCVGYRSNLYNIKEEFQIEQIMHGKYPNPVFDFAGNELVGLSPWQPGSKTLQTIANEADYQNQTLKNQGAGGIIVNEDPGDLTMEALGQMKDDVLQELGSAWRGGTNLNANKLGFLAGKWNYLKVMIDPASMQFIEQRKYTKKELCDLIGVSDKLFNNDDGAKYDNYDIALRELYTNAALPLVSGLCDDFNNPVSGLISHFGGDSVVGYDISDIPELNENAADIVKRFNDAPGFKPNDLRESLGYGRDLGPDGDVFFMKQGYSSLTDMATPEIPLDGMNDYADNNPNIR